MARDLTLTFLEQFEKQHDHGAFWNGIVWPGSQPRQSFYQWTPATWPTFKAGLDTTDRLIAAGWEQVGTWPPARDTDTTIVRLWSQLADVRLVVDTWPAVPGSAAQAWARSADAAHARAAPVILAWRAPAAVARVLPVDELLPPPAFGEIGFIQAERGDAYVQVHTAQGCGGDVLAAQQALSTALRGLATPESRQLARRRPAEWLGRWEEARTLAQQLAVAYRQHATREKLAQIPYVFDDEGMTQIPSMMPVQTILGSYSGAAAGKWTPDPDGVPTYRQTTREHDTTMQIRGDEPGAFLDDARLQQLWQQVGELGDLDGDVFLAMLAQAMVSPDDPDGVWITGAQILDYRGIQPKTARDDSGRERRAGHRYEDLVEVARRVAGQASQWVRINSVITNDATGKPKKVRQTHASRLTQISEVVYQEELMPDPERKGTLPIAWRYRMGSWLTPFLSGPNRKMAWLCQQALRYDPYHEQWEKRLARYFVFHLRINVNTGASSIKRNIKALLQDLSLEANERYPEKTRQRFQSAMDQLVTDGVIDGWEYAKNNATLPARKWLATWLSWDVQVHAGPLMTERHAPQIESAKQRREKPAKPDAKRGGKT